MTTFSPINLSLLAPPDVVETLDYETILADRKAALIALWPDDEQDEIAARLELESEPLTKLLEENAYRELVLRQRINDATRAVMLAFATGNDLDQIGAWLEVARLVITEADDTTTPPTAAVYESDTRYRQRIQLALEGFTTAGSVGAYTYHALSASALVKDVDIDCLVAGIVTVTVLSTEGDGTPTADLLATVAAALNDEDVRPLCDTVEEQAAEIVMYEVVAALTFYTGPGSELVLAAAQQAAEAYVTEQHKLGHDISRSGLFAALHQAGVQNVALTAPASDIVIERTQAAYCTGITLSNGGVDV
jgi:phage-related baseplate assembly protein